MGPGRHQGFAPLAIDVRPVGAAIGPADAGAFSCAERGGYGCFGAAEAISVMTAASGFVMVFRPPRSQTSE
jgi:hypothetical protein